nr:reverse transcriptase domain-containing protein [Tanacetum cinerariifolium]
MRTRNSYFPYNSSVTIPRRQNKRRTLNVVEPELYAIVEVAPMADNRTMEELLQAPTKGYGEAIVISKINADHFEIKTDLLQLVQANPYHGFERENPHTYINNFKRITSTLKFRDLPNDVIKLMIFTYSLEGSARVWENTSKTDDRIEKLADQISTIVDIFAKKVITPAPIKAVKESCVTCGGPHAYYNCDATNSNQPSVCAAMGTYNQVAPQNRASNYMAPPGFPPGEMKAITTRSGVSYEGPSIPTPKKVVEREIEETTDKEKTNFQGSTAHIQSLVTTIPEPGVPKTLPKPNIPYPLRLLDQKLYEKATNQMESLLTNKDKLCELAKIPLNENCSAMLLKKLLEKLGDSGKFLIPLPLILRRSFLRTGHALIDVYGEEITLRVNGESVTFNLNQTTRYSSTYDDLSVNRIDIIDVAREEYSQEILGFSKNSLGGNPTSTSEPNLSDYSPSLTPFEGSDFVLEEIETYLKDESISLKINHADCDPEGDICLIEKLLNNDPFQLPLMDLKQGSSQGKIIN